ncbi:MAG: abortive infection protein [Alphaproteobacteria bacterium]|nr:abortive infection protein [Alphaproteobacteria bacterium]
MPQRLDRTWIRIAIFYAVALSFSYLARFWWHTSDPSDPTHGPLAMYLHVVSALGPFLGAWLVWILFRPEARLSYAGTSLPISLSMLAVPAAVFGAMGVDNAYGLNPHLFGVHLGIWIALYAILEETGWRGYLQQEFRDRPALLRYVIVGLFWYAWHFSFLIGHTVSGEILGLGMVVVAAIGIGFVADRTHSIFAAASFHVVGNVLGTTHEFSALIPSSRTRLLVVLVCVGIWLAMMRVWKMRENRMAAGARA